MESSVGSGQVSSSLSRNSSLRDVRYAKKRIFGLDNTELERSKQNPGGTFNFGPEEDGASEDSANVSRCQRISSYTKVRRVVGLESLIFLPCRTCPS